MISDEKLKEIMGGIENRIRHAYNCGWNDGFGAMKEKVAKDIQERIGESIDKALEQESKHHGCSGCRHDGVGGYPCNICQRGFDDYWEAE